MSIDQALLESVEAHGEPVLRLYQWSQPTLSLGYFQSLGDRNEHRESASAACVRRATGGGAILHHHELTYSIVIPVGRSESGPRTYLYQKTHQAISQALHGFGVRAVPHKMLANQSQEKQNPFLCFQRRTDEDLIVSGYKVLGSAQRKTQHAVLQHGSLLVRASEMAPQLPGIVDLTSKSVTIESIVAGLVEELSKAISINWVVGKLKASERSRAVEIESEKFGSQNWLEKRL